LYKDQTRKYDPKAKAHEKHPIHGTPILLFVDYSIQNYKHYFNLPGYKE